MDVLDKLRATSSTIEKEYILKSNKNIPFLKDILDYTYSPYKTFGLKFHSAQLDKTIEGEPSEEMFTLLNKLSQKVLTGDAARQEVLNFAHVNGDLILRICNKSLDCGISTTTINKAFAHDVVPTFKVQLAKEVNIDKVVFPVIAQLKYNGTRCITFIHEGEVSFKTRNGHSFTFPELEKCLKKLPYFSKLSLMLDGELTFGDSRNQDHTKISGLVNSSRQGTPIPGNIGIYYNIFDCMQYKDFIFSKCNDPYYKRWPAVKEIVSSINDPIVVEAKSDLFIDRKELLSYYEKLLIEGYEGLILKSVNHKYSFKRSSDWAKMKAELRADLRCVDCIPGEGKYENAIGALLCEGYIEDSVDPGAFISVKVGSGLTDYDRNLSSSFYINKTIEIKYNKIISSSNTTTSSLFLPRFVCVRGDK